jgi:predicted ABC-type ATPase
VTCGGRGRASRPFGLSLDATGANARAWAVGRRLLEDAIRDRDDFALETTLGGRTITGLLLEAARHGFEVRVWYAGLATPELHLARVAARVRRGGHDISEHDVRRRFDESRRNLIALLPHVAEVRILDNSRDADPATGKIPQPGLVLDVRDGAILGPASLEHTPKWARPIVAAARKLAR